MTITLLSDVGTRDAYIPGIKVLLAGKAPLNNIIDISHSVEPGDVKHCAYLIRSAYAHFPKGTIHLLLAGMFTHSREKLVFAECGGHYFLSPDNGILPLAFEDKMDEALLCYEWSGGETMQDRTTVVLSVINLLQAQEIPANYYAPHYLNNSIAKQTCPVVLPNRVDCSILHVDRYGNIIININREQFYEATNNRKFSIKILGVREEISIISNHYNDVAEGKYLCRFNSFGYLEIARNCSPGDDLKNVQRAMRDVNYDRISINLQ